MSLNIGIYVYDDVEVLDFAGPYEVFTTATRMHMRDSRYDKPLFNVFMIGRTTAPVRARAGLKVDPDYSIAELVINALDHAYEQRDLLNGCSILIKEPIRQPPVPPTVMALSNGAKHEPAWQLLGYSV